MQLHVVSCLKDIEVYTLLSYIGISRNVFDMILICSWHLFMVIESRYFSNKVKLIICRSQIKVVIMMIRLGFEILV